ncbi:MAG: excalibur calcium-binding domain-containing protein [Methylobacter sp.]|uniref:excalibur calcium-binding domain-containing protein n=1 Tax=Methylobacter sp. TaxID=2051955 RepID=UPI002730D449|nr:excalibur calcium-binding domain-containing protein [Methylobacter sp.]MDP1666142.1 excalibur calcium-binding domain-containing protein [Methylobacter sp.]
MAIENNKKGKLVRWNEDRGFGFIKPDYDNTDIFIHISGLRGMSRAPIIGDIIHYETGFDDNGKARVINAKIEGMPQAMALVPIARKARPERANHQIRNAYVHRTTRSTRAKRGSKIIPIMLIVMIVLAVYSKIINQKFYPNSSKSEIAEATDIAQSPRLAEAFQCQGKVYCSEMSSYDEALFYLYNCPGTKMDGDHDGAPCESQF